MAVVACADLDRARVRIVGVYVMSADVSSASSAVSSEEERDDAVTVAG